MDESRKTGRKTSRSDLEKQNQALKKIIRELEKKNQKKTNP